jgi:hypothetical protein
MSGRPLRAFAMSALLALPLACLASLAQAGVGGGAGDVIASVRCATPVEKAQYYVFDDENYCWYDDGWQGAGWYWCGDEWDNGVGWGGPYGWNGWGGGRRHWRRGSHGVGTWHPGPPKHDRGAGPSLRPGPGGGAAPHVFHNGGADLPGVHFGGPPAFHTLSGVGPASPAFNPGGSAFHGFGGGGSSFYRLGGGGFHGGGGGGHGR